MSINKLNEGFLEDLVSKDTKKKTESSSNSLLTGKRKTRTKKSIIPVQQINQKPYQQQLGKAVDVSIIDDISTEKEYVYQFRIRPFGLGCQPDGGRKIEDGSRFGAVAYPNKLSSKDIINYDLLPITEAKEMVGLQFPVKLGKLGKLIYTVDSCNDNGIMSVTSEYFKGREKTPKNVNTYELNYFEFKNKLHTSEVDIIDETPSYQQQLDNSVITTVEPVIPQSLQSIGQQIQQVKAQQKIVEVVEEEKKKVAKKTVKKAGKKKKLVDEKIQQIVNPQQVKQLQTKETIQQKNQVKQVETVSDIVKQQVVQEIETVLPETKITEQEIETTTEVLEDANNVSLEEVNVPEIIENVGAALNEIPDGADIDIVEDIEIVPSKIKKDRKGFFKTKVNIKKNNIPDIINKIASYVKQQSKGLIKPRVCDLRVIGNTNKTQLRNSEIKLSTTTVVFKPDHTKLKVNKGTRFMISVPESYGSTGNLLVYIQESRAKTIIEVTPKDFPNIETFIEFLGDRIAEYYFHGYDVTLKKLQLRGKDNPLMSVISTVLNTRDYKAKPYVDSDNHLYSVDFVSNSDENQWLTVQILESNSMPGVYDIIGINSVSGDEYALINEPKTIKWLEDNLVTVLNKSYSKDWSSVLNTGDDALEAEYYMLGKLKHRSLRSVFVDLNNLREDKPELGIEILKTASHKDMIKLQKTDYDAEAIIGKTPSLKIFILTYLAYQIIGGDSRKGRDYITRQQYYQKYHVNDRRQYQQRENTILKKQNVERNYNSRPYLFQLEYIDNNGNKNVYRAKKFDEIVNVTKFLTNSPNMNIESPIK